MKKTLVLVVDRDDDFGVKGKVNTPVIGVQGCLDAATAFGIADPEDSDLNALFSAVSTCLEIQEDGQDAEVALICGDEKVGHRSDLALVSQLEVLDKVKPSSIVLVGDGAEDEYIYPIVSSRANVDSVRKVYVKQAPGLEGLLYIFTKMLSDENKRKRFLAPLGIIMILLSLVFIVPRSLVYLVEGDISTIAGMSGSLALFMVGFLLMLYAYNFSDKMSSLKRYLNNNILKKSTPFIFLCLSLMVIALSLIWTFYEVQDMYMTSTLSTVLYYIASMIWPVTMSIIIYVVGVIIDKYQASRTIHLSQVFGCLSLASIAMVAQGIMDLIQVYVSGSYSSSIGVLEIVGGIALSIFLNFIQSRMRNSNETPEQVIDEVQ